MTLRDRFIEDLGEGVRERIKGIRLVIFDVDGVLTDGGIIYSGNGHDIKTFNVKDGHGIRLLMASGIDCAIISARQSKTVDERAKDLGISLVYQGERDKVIALDAILKAKAMSPSEAAFIGDDLIDIPVLKRVGFSSAPYDAVREVRGIVHYITREMGGHGAARELIELILKVQGKWDGIIQSLNRG